MVILGKQASQFSSEMPLAQLGLTGSGRSDFGNWMPSGHFEFITTLKDRRDWADPIPNRITSELGVEPPQSVAPISGQGSRDPICFPLGPGSDWGFPTPLEGSKNPPPPKP